MLVTTFFWVSPRLNPKYPWPALQNKKEKKKKMTAMLASLQEVNDVLVQWGADSSQVKVLGQSVLSGAALGAFAVLSGLNPVMWVVGGAALGGYLATKRQNKELEARNEAQKKHFRRLVEAFPEFEGHQDKPQDVVKGMSDRRKQQLIAYFIDEELIHP